MASIDHQRYTHTFRHSFTTLLLDAGCAVIILHDRWFFDRVAIHILAFEGNSEAKKHLPDKYHAEYHRKMRAAYKMTSYTDAGQALESVAKELERLNDDAAGSLREGLEETLMLRMGLTGIPVSICKPDLHGYHIYVSTQQPIFQP